jgi:hypothetical protein
VFQLRGYDKITGQDKHEKFDRGELEIEICWRERLYEYDLELAQQKHTMARRIQCMARKFAAKKATKKARKERDDNLKIANRSSELVSAAIRMRIALKIVAYKKLWVLSALKIQMRVRMYQAERKLMRRKIEFYNATIITKHCRVFLARRLLAWLRWQRAELLRISTTTIQRQVRRLLAELTAVDMEKNLVYEKRYEHTSSWEAVIVSKAPHPTPLFSLLLLPPPTTGTRRNCWRA